MALTNCDQLLKKFLDNNNIDTSKIDLERIGAEIEAKRLDIESSGRTLDSFIEGSTVYKEKDMLIHNVFAKYFKDNLFTRQDLNSTNTLVLANKMLDLERNAEHLLKYEKTNQQRKKLKALDDEYVGKDKNTDDYKNRKKEIENENKSTRAIKAWKALFFNSGDTWGHETLEGLIDSIAKLKQSGIAVKVKELLQKAGVKEDIDPFMVWTQNYDLKTTKTVADLFTGEKKTVKIKFQEAVIQEIFDIANNGEAMGGRYIEAAGKNTSGDKTANALARAMYEALTLPSWHELNSLGRKVNVYDSTPKLIFKKFKIKDLEKKWRGSETYKRYVAQEKNKNPNFREDSITGNEIVIKLLAENMHARHGDLAQRQSLAKQIYNKLMETGNWRDADTIVSQIRKQAIAESMTDNMSGNKQIRKQMNSDMPGVLRFQDGAAFNRVNEVLGADISLQETLHRLIMEQSRITGMTKFLGPEFETTYAKLKKAVSEGSDIENPDIFDGAFNTQDMNAGSFFDKRFAKASDDYVTHLMNPALSENIDGGAVSTFLGVARNTMVVKLGSALISNFADLATFWSVAKNSLGSERSMLKAITGHDFVGTKQERKLYASAFMDFTEVYVGTMQDRFRMIDHGDRGSISKMGDKFMKGSAALAHNTLKLTGFHAWNRTASIGAVSLIQREIGDMISGRKKWVDLKPQQKLMFEKFGFAEREFTEMVSAGTNALDGSGRFNLQGYDSWLKKNGPNISDSRVTKLIAVVNDLSEAMVLKPGALDRAAAGFFSKPGSVTDQFFRSVTQFKTFMIAHSRKLLMNQRLISRVQNGEYLGVAMSTAHLMAPMMIMSYAVVQLKQFIAGKEFYSDPAASFNAMMQYTNIIPFMGDMYWQNGGEGLFNILSLQDNEKLKKTGISVESFARSIMGPALDDFTKFSDAMVNLGEAGVLSARGRDTDAKKVFNLSVSKFTKTLQGLDPFAQVWYTKAFYRALTYDAFLEYYNPKAYNNTKRRLERRATDERVNGELYNWVFKDLYK